MLANNDIGNLGRLGNQMFQYASLRGLASKHDYGYCLPPKDCVGSKDPNCAASDYSIFDCFKLPEAPTMLPSFMKVEERCFELDEFLWNSCPDNVSLFGYFQTEKYFKHIETEIREAFTFIDEIKDPCQEQFYSSFGDTNVIAVHLRRGDYLNSTHHPIQSNEYYQEGLTYFNKDLPVMIFSDDIEWCRQQELFSDDRFIFSENSNTAVDLCLMSLCSYHIIANSSFSWWGAWLAKSKKVIAPQRWFGPPLTHNTKDLYLEDWILK